MVMKEGAASEGLHEVGRYPTEVTNSLLILNQSTPPDKNIVVAPEVITTWTP